MNLIDQLKLRLAGNPAALQQALAYVEAHAAPDSLSLDQVLSAIRQGGQRIQFGLRNFGVDSDKGRLTRLSLITAGREATGHGIYIDEKTLQTALASVQEKGGKLKAYIAHATFSEWWEGTDRLMNVPGYFSDISIAGDQLVAGVFEFYDSFREASPEDYNRLLEMAEKTPELFGLSIEAWGYGVYIAEDGTEYSSPPEDVELKHNGMPVFRVTSLDAAAFVSEPAANDGLLAKMRRLVAGKKQDGALEALLAAYLTTAAPGDGNGQTSHHKTNTDMNLIKALKAKFADDPARLQKALAIVADHNDPDSLTLEQVVTQLDANELAELRAENARLAKEQSTAEEKRLAAEKEAKENKEKFTAIRESGRATEISFGVPSLMQHKLTGFTAMAIDALASEGRFNFAAERTSIADIYVPSVWIPGVREKMNKLPGLWNSPVVMKSPEFDGIASGAGTAATIPFWGDVTDFEDAPQVENTAPETKKIADAEQIATILNRELPFERTALAAQVGALGDPLGAVLEQLASNRAKNAQRVLINVARGFIATALAANSTGAISESIAGQTSANLIDAAKINAAVATLGELVSDLRNCVIVAHPTIIAALKDQDENSFIRPSANGDLFMETYKGVPIIPNSALVRAGTTDGFVYDTWILGTGLVAYGEKMQSSQIGDVASLVVEGDAAKNNVSLYDRRRYLVHVRGARWVGTPGGQSATNAELATSGNWELAYSSADRVPMVRILSNG